MPKIPLILIPGLLCDAALWAHQRRHLTDVADVTIGDTLRDDSIVAMAGRILAQAPERFALAGLSMGGYISLEILRQAPERVNKLALLDTSARQDPPELARRRRGLIALARRGQYKGVTPRLLPLYIHESRLQDQALVRTITDMAARTGRETFIRQQTAILGREDRRDVLSHIAVPTLVLCGRQDQVTPLSRSEEMATTIPPATLHVVEDCGHLSTLERPEEVTDVMRQWLTEKTKIQH